jgi:phosphonate transport system permease protein
MSARTWRPPPLIANPWLRWAIVVGAAVYLYVALNSIPINWLRLADGWSRGWLFIKGFLTPDFVSRQDEIIEGLVESLVMTVVATALGIALSIPVALAAARNIAPRPVYLLARSFIAVARTFQEVIIAILFVAMFGFGPFAGMLTIAFVTIGFMAKLLAEDIEDIEPGQAEAIRGTGASWLQLMNYGIQPQVLPRLIGLSLYRIDINFRESAVVGIVGAGGIGATLNTAFGRYEYSVAAAIMLIIIVIVMACEYGSSLVRKWVQ